jgi:hypothetical protein
LSVREYRYSDGDRRCGLARVQRWTCFAGDGFDIAVEKVADIERRVGTADLASFTAPPIFLANRAT